MAAAAATATAALACAAGCILPFALPAVVLAGTGGVIAWLVRAQGWMMILAVVAVAAGWIWVGLLSLRYRAKPALSTFGVMIAATLALALAAVWFALEPTFVRLMIS